MKKATTVTNINPVHDIKETWLKHENIKSNQHTVYKLSLKRITKTCLLKCQNKTNNKVNVFKTNFVYSTVEIKQRMKTFDFVQIMLDIPFH